MKTPWQQTPPAGPPTREAVLAWLVERIADELKMSPAEVDPEDPFARYGVDSVVAAELACALEEWVERDLEPMLFYDTPSLRLLAAAVTDA